MPSPSTTLVAKHHDPEVALYQQPPKILIVEDEAIIALDIQRQLVHAGFSVSGIAQTAPQAFRHVEREIPDLVLMDIHIKGEMDGVQAASIIRNRYNLPVIYLTAHSDDTTLKRARMTQPYGFLVKPLVNTNVKAAITMAIYKHQAEREIENNRRVLTTILQGLPDAVLVAHPLGEVLFLNRAAEQITGYPSSDATGSSVFDIAPVQDGQGRAMLLRLFQKVVVEKAPARIDPGSTITRADGTRVAVSGQISVMLLEERLAAVFIALSDESKQKNADLRVSQERQMVVAGELAQAVAQEFFSLFDLIDGAADGAAQGIEGERDLVRKASRIGKGMATQLLELNEAVGSAHVVNVKQCLFSSRALLQKVCGSDIRLTISAVPDVGYVLATGNHFEQMLVNLALEARQRLGGRGSLIVGACVHKEPEPPVRSDSYIRIFVRGERDGAFSSASEDAFTLGAELPELGLALVRTIAASSHGFTRLTDPDDAVFVLEVFLPRQESRLAATTASNEYSHVVLSVGIDASLSGDLKQGLGDDVLLITASAAEEAAWISESYEGDIDLVILGENLAAELRDGACARIRARRPGVLLFQLPASDQVELVQRVKDVLDGKKPAALGVSG
jgi:PAS domain S-box-containing protein